MIDLYIKEHKSTMNRSRKPTYSIVLTTMVAYNHAAYPNAKNKDAFLIHLNNYRRFCIMFPDVVEWMNKEHKDPNAVLFEPTLNFYFTSDVKTAIYVKFNTHYQAKKFKKKWDSHYHLFAITKGLTGKSLVVQYNPYNWIGMNATAETVSEYFPEEGFTFFTDFRKEEIITKIVNKLNFPIFAGYVDINFSDEKEVRFRNKIEKKLFMQKYTSSLVHQRLMKPPPKLFSKWSTKGRRRRIV